MTLKRLFLNQNNTGKRVDSVQDTIGARLEKMRLALKEIATRRPEGPVQPFHLQNQNLIIFLFFLYCCDKLLL